MKSKRLWPALLLTISLLGVVSCVTGGDDGNGDDDAVVPNFVQETCSGCIKDEAITSGGTISGYRFYSYVKNSGGSGKINMTIGAGSSTASKEFTVTAGTSYVFHCWVSVQANATASFTYQARFPGTAGYTDSHTINGYNCSGGPFDMQLNPR